MRFLSIIFFVLFSLPTNAASLQNISPPLLLPPLVFEDDNGVQHTLSDYKGRFVLLNLWATWCAPCVREMPSLATLQKNFDVKDFIFVPLSEDRSADQVSAFYATHHLSLPIAIDNAGRAPSVLHLRGLPTSILINPKGEEIARMEGDAGWTTPEMIDMLRQLMSHN
jgi:thiol-disulfide isomerase/thioredoxin